MPAAFGNDPAFNAPIGTPIFQPSDGNAAPAVTL